jgi:hypothetical protein
LPTGYKFELRERNDGWTVYAWSLSGKERWFGRLAMRGLADAAEVHKFIGLVMRHGKEAFDPDFSMPILRPPRKPRPETKKGDKK